MRESLLLGLLGAVLSYPAAAVEMYKCGATFQDRPCAAQDVQQRFSRTSGDFSIEQVNLQSDPDCARAARTAMPFWERLQRGEPLAAVQADVDKERRMSRFERSTVRDALIAIREHRGTPLAVRSQFETQCMAYKRRLAGRATVSGPDRYAVAEAERTSLQAIARAHREAQWRARRAEAEWRALNR